MAKNYNRPWKMERYGITEEQYQAMLTSQNGDCALKSFSCSGVLCIDHRGDTVRGILCFHHNILVGYFEAFLREEKSLDDYVDGKLTKFLKTETLAKKSVCAEPTCQQKVLAGRYCGTHYQTKRLIRKRKS